MVDSRLSRLRVLVVDDNHHMIELVKTILRGFGMRDILEARDAVDAFDILRASTVDFIITDYAMEPLNGCEFTRMVRTAEDSPNRFIPIIMLSAYSERSRVAEARDSGVTEFCAKPVTANELYRKVMAIVNHPRSFIRLMGFFGPDRRRRRGISVDKDRRSVMS